MREHQWTHAQLSEYVDHDLCPGDRARVAEHLGLCPACQVARRTGLPAPQTARWVAWWIGCAAMVDWHLGMVEAADGAARERLGAADAVSLSRVALVPFVAAARTRRGPFVALLAVAAATDAADGRLARHSGCTRLGRDLDTMGDAVVGIAAALCARRSGWLTTRTALLVVARHLIPIAFAALAYFARGGATAALLSATANAPAARNSPHRR